MHALASNEHHSQLPRRGRLAQYGAVPTRTGDIRAIVNAIVAIDALAGALYSATKEEPTTTAAMATDDKFRDHLAENCREFRVLRDPSAAYKHGHLSHPKKNQPQLLLNPERVCEIDNQLGIMECGDRIQGKVLLIELTDEQWMTASHAIRTSYQLLRSMVLDIVA